MAMTKDVITRIRFKIYTCLLRLSHKPFKDVAVFFELSIVVHLSRIENDLLQRRQKLKDLIGVQVLWVRGVYAAEKRAELQLYTNMESQLSSTGRNTSEHSCRVVCIWPAHLHHE